MTTADAPPERLRFDVDPDMIRGFERTYHLLTRGVRDGASIFDPANRWHGVYPVRHQGRLIGFRLGMSDMPAPNGASCFLAFVHPPELASTHAIEVVYDLWRSTIHPAARNLPPAEQPGDLYGIFAGEEAQVEALFATLLDGRTSISAALLRTFRMTSDGMTNSNRVPRDEPDPSAPESLRRLWAFSRFLRTHIYARCGARWKHLPCFIAGLHNYSTPGPAGDERGPTIAYPYDGPYPPREHAPGEPNPAYDRAREVAMRSVTELFGEMGVDEVIIEEFPDFFAPYLESISRLELGAEDDAVTDPWPPRRMTLETGQSLHPRSVTAAAAMARALLRAILPPRLAALIPRTDNPATGFRVHRGVAHLYHPNAAGARNSFQGEPRRPPDGRYGDLVLITGREFTPAGRKAFRASDGAIVPAHLAGLPREVLLAMATAPDNPFAYGTSIAQGQVLGHLEILNDRGSVIRTEAWRSPLSGPAFMAPADNRVPANQQEYVIGVSLEPQTVTLRNGTAPRVRR